MTSENVQAAQLIAEGPQDIWLTGDPQASFFRSMYRRHVSYGMSVEQFNLNGDTIRFDRRGDLLGACYLTASDPVTNVQLSTFPISSIARVDLFIGGQLVDSQDTTFSSQVWPVTEATTWSERNVPSSFYPLHFFFCKDWSRAFPLVALEYHDLEIKIRDASSSYTFTLWAHMIHLSDPERAWYKRQPHRFLITQTQTARIDLQRDWGRFGGPIKYLAWPAQKTSTQSSSQSSITQFTVLDGTGTDIGYGITTDTSGNMYVTGRYFSAGSTVTINNLALNSSLVPSGYTLPSGSRGIMFILQYDSTGKFAKRAILSGVGTSNYLYSITTDTSGNMYVTGQYSSAAGTLTINNLALSSSSSPSGYVLPTVSTNAVFVLKYDSTGTLAGFTVINGTGLDTGYSITTDTSGNIYVTGVYASTAPVTINNLALNSSLVPSGYTLPTTTITTNAVFILKYDSTGTIVGFTMFDSIGADTGYSITTDTSGNMYVTGTYTSSGPVTINNLALNSSLVPSGYTLPATTITTSAVFVLKYDYSGTIAGFTVFDGTGSDTGYSITTDTSGNIYVTGVYASTAPVTINNLALNSSLVPSGYTLPTTTITTNAVFILKYDSTGTIVGFTMFDSIGADTGYSITTDTSGNMYVTGTYASSSPVTINNLALNSSLVPSGYTLPAISTSGVFILKYTNDGGITLRTDYQFKTQVNGVDIGESRHLVQWTDVNAYYHTQHGYLASNVAIVPFCLDTSSYQPTGTLNFSRIDKFEIATPPAVTLPSMAAGQYMYAVGYNIIEIRDGTSSLLYWD